MMENARVIIEVTAGLVPGQPLPEYTRRWTITTETWEQMRNGKDKETRMAAYDTWDTVHGSAREYAARLCNPGTLNWVRTDWVWL